MFEPPEIHHERLLVVSVLGFCVNMIGIFAFHHGGASHHGHSHGGGGDSHHGHSHGVSSSHTHSHDHGHSHDHNDNHGHSHHANGHSLHHETLNLDWNEGQAEPQQQQQQKKGENKIFQGVFLHILADTLGSIGVIISSLLIRFFNWHIADPICSMVIAFLISMR